jgi:hypothetical protein
MAALRNRAIGPRLTGRTSIADGLRHHARNPARPLTTLAIRSSNRTARQNGAALAA